MAVIVGEFVWYVFLLLKRRDKGISKNLQEAVDLGGLKTIVLMSGGNLQLRHHDWSGY